MSRRVAFYCLRCLVFIALGLIMLGHLKATGGSPDLLFFGILAFFWFSCSLLIDSLVKADSKMLRLRTSIFAMADIYVGVSAICWTIPSSGPVLRRASSQGR